METTRPFTRTQRRRLTILSAFLRKFKPKRRKLFNMSFWARHSLRHKPKSIMSCGTAGCAAGWATAIPALRREGLRLGWTKGPQQYEAYITTRGTRKYRDEFDDTGTFSSNVLRKFFGTDVPFAPMNYRHPGDIDLWRSSAAIQPVEVADKIDALLADDLAKKAEAKRDGVTLP